ncbi:MAG: hypothetical protein ACPIOQ_58930 [Promethearchaeia archaeon]
MRAPVCVCVCVCARARMCTDAGPRECLRKHLARRTPGRVGFHACMPGSEGPACPLAGGFYATTRMQKKRAANLI